MDIVVQLGSLAAVGLLIGLAYLVHGRGAATPLTDAAAQTRYSADFWSDMIRKTLLSTDRRTALILLRDPVAIGLVQTMGDKAVTRRLSGDDIKDLSLDGTALSFCVKEFAASRITLLLSEEEAGNAHAYLSHLMKE